jgi:hypothetical protein
MDFKFNIGDKIYYLFMDSVCESTIKNSYTKNGENLYSDNIFDNLKECYIFKSPKECIEFHKKKHIIN